MTATTDWTTLARDALRPSALGHTVRAVRTRVHSQSHSVGLARDLRAPHETPQALVPLRVRVLEERDVPFVLGDEDGLDNEELWDRATRRRLLAAGIGTPYVAAAENDEPCYVQWLFGARENDDVNAFFGGLFPALDPDMALLEGAFTPAAHRGRRIMSAAMSMIAEKAADLGARYVITFVAADNGASLKGCARAGFAPYVDRTENFRMGRRTISFAEQRPNG